MSLYALEDSFKILSPKDNSLQNELTLNIVIESKASNFDTLKIVTSKEQISIDTDNTKKIYCKNISLRLGENRISVRFYKNKKIVEEKIRRIYVASQLYHQFKYPPQIYKPTYFHNDKNEKICSTCHDMSVNEVEDIAFIDVTKSNCYTCHKNLTKEKYAHAPAVNWLCTSCHNINSKDKSKYTHIEPVSESCLECHLANKETWEDAKYNHEPLDSGHCNKCHNPHSSPYNMFLRKPINQICMGCHKDKHMKAREIKNSTCGYDKKKLCTSCHTPHASNRPFFLKDIVKEKTR